MTGHARRGFTLFEVMAAVIILGLLYTMLASTAIEGLRAEGTSRRRLEASLLADQTLSDLEAELAAGVTPALGSREEEQGEYRVTVDVTPFDPTPFLPVVDEAPEPTGPSLLSAPVAGEPALLRRIEVSVGWTEGLDEKRVERTTLAYDVATAESYLGAAGVDTGAGGAGSDAGSDADSDADADAANGGSGSGSSGRPGGGGTQVSDEIQKMLEQLRNAR